MNLDVCVIFVHITHRMKLFGRYLRVRRRGKEQHFRCFFVVFCQERRSLQARLLSHKYAPRHHLWDAFRHREYFSRTSTIITVSMIIACTPRLDFLLSFDNIESFPSGEIVGEVV